MATNGRRTVKKTVRIARARAGARARSQALTAEERSNIARRAIMARYQGLSKAERSEVARKAVRARWAREKSRKER